MDDPITIGDGFHPIARPYWIALDEGGIVAEQLSGMIGSARQDDDLITAFVQTPDQPSAHQSCCAGDKDAHGIIQNLRSKLSREPLGKCCRACLQLAAKPNQTHCTGSVSCLLAHTCSCGN